MTTKRAILFLLFLLVLAIFCVSYNIKGYQTPTVRTNIVHPVYVLGPRNLGKALGYDEKLAMGRKPPRFGPMGWFYNGSMVFRTSEEARFYMSRNFHAYPPNKTGVYWASGEFDLDTRQLENGSYVLTRTLQVEGLAETFNAHQPSQPKPKNPAVNPAPAPAPATPGMGMGFGSFAMPGPAPAAPAPAVPAPAVPAPATVPVPAPVAP
jgi:hypothetical protein